MANRYAVASGNFNATSTWATTAAGAAGASVPVAGDVAISNNRTVTIPANATCTEIRNDNFSGATAGGGFILNDGVTLTANVIGGNASASKCVTYQGTTSAEIVGDCTGGTGSFSEPNQTIGVYHNGTGTLTVTGTNHSGGTGQAAAAFKTNSTGILNITGNILALATTNARTIMPGGGVINITGNVTGSTSVLGGVNQTIGTSASATGFSSTITIIGNVASGLGGIAVNVGAGTLSVTGSISAVNGFAAIESSSNSATIRASGSFISAADGTLPIYARKFILNTTPTAAKTRYALSGSGTYTDMFTADNTGLAPAVTDVRAGVVYGSATGVLAVPAASSVAFGVPVDNTTGTAVLTPEAVWSAATRTLTAGAGISASDVWSYATRTITGGTVTTLTNAPNVPTPSAIADEVWNRQASAITTTNSIGERVKNTATTAILGNLLAQSNS